MVEDVVSLVIEGEIYALGIGGARETLESVGTSIMGVVGTFLGAG